MITTALRRWFVVHFVADLVAAIPLFVAPRAVLHFLGWTEVDPIATRIVAAALAGIGIESLLGRNADASAFRAMLNLKVVWSAFATLGVLWSIAEGAPPAAWGILAIFAGFHVIWLRYRLTLGRGS